MQVQDAVANLIPGREVSYIARCLDCLIENEYSDPAILSQLTPFLGQNLLSTNVVDYSVDSGVDVCSTYFVLWEPFVRAKATHLVGIIVEKAENVPDLSGIINSLLTILNSDEDLEKLYAFITLTNIGRKIPSAILPHFQSLCKIATAIINYATNAPNAFTIYRLPQFVIQVYECFLEFALIDGILNSPENMQRFISVGIQINLVQIASKYAMIEKSQKPAILWNLMWVFLKIVTEHPNGPSLFDLDNLPKPGEEIHIAMRIALTDRSKAGGMRNALDSVPADKRDLENFKKFTKLASHK